MIDNAAIDRLAARQRTPLEIGRYLVLVFEAGLAAGAKPVSLGVVDSVLSTRIDDLEPKLTRHGYDAKAIADQFGARIAKFTSWSAVLSMTAAPAC